MRTKNEHTDLAIISPAETAMVLPKGISRRTMLSTMGAMGTGIALQASVGGLSLLASGSAMASTPVGTRQLSIKQTLTVPTPGVNKVTYNEWWYISENAWGYPEVRAWVRTDIVYVSPVKPTVTTYQYMGLTSNSATQTTTYDSAGVQLCSIALADLDVGVGTCRRLNQSGTENLDANFARSGWTNYGAVACARLGTAAAEFVYKKYRDTSGNTHYRFFRRNGSAGGLTATGILLYSGITGTALDKMDTFINGFATIKTNRDLIIAVPVTAAVAAGVGVTVAGINQFTNSTIMAVSGGLLAAITLGGPVLSVYNTYAAALQTVSHAMDYFSTSTVDDLTDCVA